MLKRDSSGSRRLLKRLFEHLSLFNNSNNSGENGRKKINYVRIPSKHRLSRYRLKFRRALRFYQAKRTFSLSLSIKRRKKTVYTEKGLSSKYIETKLNVNTEHFHSKFARPPRVEKENGIHCSRAVNAAKFSLGCLVIGKRGSGGNRGVRWHDVINLDD